MTASSIANRRRTTAKLERYLHEHGLTRLDAGDVSWRSQITLTCTRCGGPRPTTAGSLLQYGGDQCRQCAIHTVRETRERNLKWGSVIWHTVVRRMIDAHRRCIQPQRPDYHNYGGRGVQFKFPTARLAASWMLTHIGPPPSPDHTIDRIDNHGHYEPGNLRWATHSEQALNRRKREKS